MESLEDAYIFWLLDWGVTPVYTITLWSGSYRLCQISRQELIIHVSPEPIRIAISDITACEAYGFSRGPKSGATMNVKLIIAPEKQVVQGRLKRNEVFLVAANPLTYDNSIPDCKDMISVIQSFRQGNTPNLPVNPYEREFARLGKSNEFVADKWDANLPPEHYRPTLSLSKIIVQVLFAALIGGGSVFAIFWLLFYFFAEQ